ncbi:ATP-binding protein [Georgenia sp. SUBG003]|uniref:ATP-binding protein n=1 Tax=Georgenia sp. SUBG003 TaxID=1497974 RepID=UPI0004D97D8C|nr:hypothetical protein DA06_15460 [Georgenia sp. SUBG003]
MLAGRDPERAAVSALLDSARAGAGGALVVHGLPGVGKSALLAEAADGATGMTVLRTRGIESESPLAFAALHRLLRPVLGLTDKLPAPQARALRAALGESDDGDADRFLVFLGALSLLSAAAEDTPVLVVADDAHWLDEASTAALQFVARRVDDEKVAVLFAPATATSAPSTPATSRASSSPGSTTTPRPPSSPSTPPARCRRTCASASRAAPAGTRSRSSSSRKPSPPPSSPGPSRCPRSCR